MLRDFVATSLELVAVDTLTLNHIVQKALETIFLSMWFMLMAFV